MDEQKIHDALIRLSDKIEDIKDSNHAIEKAYVEQAGEFKALSAVVGDLAAKVATLESKFFDRRLKDAELNQRVDKMEADAEGIKKKLEVLDEHNRIIQYERTLLGWLVKAMPAAGIATAFTFLASLFNKGQ